MQTNRSLLLVWIMIFVVEGQSPYVPCPLTQNFVKLSPSGKFTGCRPCPECPEGHGLNIQCGSLIPEDKKIRCVPCKKTKTYSNSHGVESCKPCQECGLLNVLQECTTEHNRKCGHKCPKGYFFDGRIAGCRENTPATVTATTLSAEPSPKIWPTNIPITTVSSTPNIKPSHSTLMSVLSAETPGSIKVPLIVENRSSTSVESTPSIAPQLSSLYHGIASTSTPGSMEGPLPGRNEGATTILVKILVTMLVTIVLIVIVTLTAIVCRTKCRMSRKTKPEQKVFHGDQGDDTDCVLENYILEVQPGDQGHDTDCILENDIPEVVKLADHQYAIDDFTLPLDIDSTPSQKNWKHVANQFQVSLKDIQFLDNENKKPGGSAMRHLIPILGSAKCVTLKKFVDVLQELERNDVANQILHWFREKQDTIRCSVDNYLTETAL